MSIPNDKISVCTWYQRIKAVADKGQNRFAVMLTGFQCSESLGPTGGHLSGSKGNSVVPPQKIVISVVCCVKNLYWMLYHYNNRC